MYDSTLIQNIQITIKYVKLRLLLTHYCLHVSLGLFAMQKGEHAEVSHGCASRRSSSLWGQTQDQMEERLGVWSSYELHKTGPNHWPRLCFHCRRRQSPPPGKVPPSRGCSTPLHVGNSSIAHTATFSLSFQMHFFSSMVSCCCLMLYRVCLLSQIWLLPFFTINLWYIWKIWKCLLCSFRPSYFMTLTEEIASIS